MKIEICIVDQKSLSISDLQILCGPAQDVPFFYTTSHLSELQSLSQLFQLIYMAFSYLNILQHFSGIELCR